MAEELNNTSWKSDSSLKAYYRFNNGAIATDSSDAARTLSTNGSPASNASGRFGYCADFLGGTDLTLGDTSTSLAFTTNYWRAQSFAPAKRYLSEVVLQLKKVGSPTGNITITIEGDNGSNLPNGTELATYTLSVSSLTTSYGAYTIPLLCSLTAGTTYWVVVKGQSAWDASNDLNWASKAGTYTKYRAYSSTGSWVNSDKTHQHSVITHYLNESNFLYDNTDLTSTDYKLTGNYTLGAWIKHPSAPADGAIVSTWDNITAKYYGNMLQVNTSGKALLYQAFGTGTVSGTDYKVAQSTTLVDDNSWHFIVGTYNGTNLKIYVDGSLEATTASNAAVFPTDTYFRIAGRREQDSEKTIKWYNGSLDDVFVLKGTALSDTQVYELYHTTMSIQEVLHSQYADNTTLVQHYTAVIQDSLHTQLSDNVSIIQHYLLAVADTLHNHLADSTYLSQRLILTIAETLHNNIADIPLLTQKCLLQVQESLHGHSADNLLITQIHNLLVDSSEHTQFSDNISLIQKIIISAQKAIHAQTVDTANLIQRHFLALQDSNHSQTSDNLELLVWALLGINDALHIQYSEQIRIIQQYLLLVSDSRHSSKSDNISKIIDWGELGRFLGIYKTDFADSGNITSEELAEAILLKKRYVSSQDLTNINIDDPNTLKKFFKSSGVL